MFENCLKEMEVETVISAFKRIISENISARVWRNVVREIKFKAMTYNLMIDGAMELEIDWALDWNLF